MHHPFFTPSALPPPLQHLSSSPPTASTFRQFDHLSIKFARCAPKRIPAAATTAMCSRMGARRRRRRVVGIATHTPSWPAAIITHAAAATNPISTIAPQLSRQLDAAEVGKARGGRGADAQQAIDKRAGVHMSAQATALPGARQRRRRVPAHTEAQRQRGTDDETHVARGGRRRVRRSGVDDAGRQVARRRV